MSQSVPVYFTPLYKLLMDGFPEHRTPRGILAVYQIAHLAGVTHVNVYSALKRQCMTSALASKLTNVSDGRLKFDDFVPYIEANEAKKTLKAA